MYKLKEMNWKQSSISWVWNTFYWQLNFPSGKSEIIFYFLGAPKFGLLYHKVFNITFVLQNALLCGFVARYLLLISRTALFKNIIGQMLCPRWQFTEMYRRTNEMLQLKKEKLSGVTPYIANEQFVRTTLCKS